MESFVLKFDQKENLHDWTDHESLAMQCLYFPIHSKQFTVNSNENLKVRFHRLFLWLLPGWVVLLTLPNMGSHCTNWLKARFGKVPSKSFQNPLSLNFVVRELLNQTTTVFFNWCLQIFTSKAQQACRFYRNSSDKRGRKLAALKLKSKKCDSHSDVNNW